MEPCTFTEGLPTFNNGATGIYVKETMPVTLLLQMEDSLPMQQFDGRVLERAKMNSKVNEGLDPENNAHTNALAHQPCHKPRLELHQGQERGQQGHKTDNKPAVQILVLHICTNIVGDTKKQAYNNLCSSGAKCNKLDTTMFAFISTIHRV